MIFCWKSPLIFSFFVLFTFSKHASSSAIPMWEFLSRNEKINHLFNTFIKQTAEYCQSTDLADCNKILLVYGLMNLAGMDDESLDKMDPYQRGANDLIWESMMGRRTHETPSESKENTDQNSAVDALEISTNENDLGSASSNNIEEISENSHYSGSMFVRVYTDGSPVLDDKSAIMKDEDLAEHVAMRASINPFNSNFIKRNLSKSNKLPFYS